MLRIKLPVSELQSGLQKGLLSCFLFFVFFFFFFYVCVMDVLCIMDVLQFKTWFQHLESLLHQGHDQTTWCDVDVKFFNVYKMLTSPNEEYVVARFNHFSLTIHFFFS